MPLVRRYIYILGGDRNGQKNLACTHRDHSLLAVWPVQRSTKRLSICKEMLHYI